MITVFPFDNVCVEAKYSDTDDLHVYLTPVRGHHDYRTTPLMDRDTFDKTQYYGTK